MLQQLADQRASNRIIKTVPDEVLEGNLGDLIMYQFEIEEFWFRWIRYELPEMSERARARAKEHLSTVAKCRAKVAPHVLSETLPQRSGSSSKGASLQEHLQVWWIWLLICCTLMSSLVQ